MRLLILCLLLAACVLPASADDYALPANEKLAWNYANELFMLTRAYGVVAEKTPEELEALTPRAMDLLERLNGDIAYWRKEMTVEDILMDIPALADGLKQRLSEIEAAVSRTVACLLEKDFTTGAAFLPSLYRKCEEVARYFHEYNY